MNATSPRLHVAVFIFADFGHINPTLGVARELLARGHRVTYVIDERFADRVEQSGARAVTYASGRGAFYKATHPTADELADDGHRLFIETMDTVVPLAASAFENDSPDVVLYDFETVVAGRMTARTFDATSIQVNPSYASNEEFSMRAMVWKADHPVIQACVTALIEFLQANGIGLEEYSRFGDEWDERNLVFLPREFHIKGDTFGDRYSFVGPTATQYDGDISWTPPGDGRRVALVSLGTEAVGQQEFFQACAQVFNEREWHVVMTVGSDFDPTQLGALPPNVEVHPWLPHPVILPHVDVLVCHAGMGSVMEALYFATPVVAVPRAHELELTARRLEELGLGRMIPVDDLSASAIAEAVQGLLAAPGLDERLALMREHLIASGGAPRAADLVERWAAEAAKPAVSAQPSTAL
ncbi:macrolide family glycosyltransferase [Streptomyces sp. TP-A0356]|uniref:macrolide family glycosyltransferase n=1 Tax=Streptomyces sp. TP-A0356 TaxID=1359208 RepID=UPI0006E3C6A1|nr:macrolide family glycosyltransferase [Streptomyces sp. TP-A0356]